MSADEPLRAKIFYEKIFDWEFELAPGMDYQFIKIKVLDGKETDLIGGMGKRMAPDQKITNYIGFENIAEHMKKVQELGDKIIQPKMCRYRAGGICAFIWILKAIYLAFGWRKVMQNKIWKNCFLV